MVSLAYVVVGHVVTHVALYRYATDEHDVHDVDESHTSQFVEQPAHHQSIETAIMLHN
jgi:hypothetical protein